MSRQRDYQPTIDRANNQAEIARRREAKLREKVDSRHRDMLRAREVARIAGEEADALRVQVERLESSVRDLRANARDLRLERDQAHQNWALALQDVLALREAKQGGPIMRIREWMRDMLRIGAEA